MRCPKCGSRSTGRIGQDQYYCWDCNVEFHMQGKSARIYSIDPEGSATLESVKSPNETELDSIRDNTVSGYTRGQEMQPRDQSSSSTHDSTGQGYDGGVEVEPRDRTVRSIRDDRQRTRSVGGTKS